MMQFGFLFNEATLVATALQVHRDVTIFAFHQRIDTDDDASGAAIGDPRWLFLFEQETSQHLPISAEDILKKSSISETIGEKEELMAKLLERLGSRIGRRCPGCGLREWNSHFEIHEIRHWAQRTQGWYDREYRIVEYTHLTCGHTWTAQQDINRPTAFTGV